MDQHYRYRQWKRMAPLGLGAIGTGLSFIGEATLMKGRGSEPLAWVLMGSVGLIVFNAGVAMFGEAVKQRTLYEWHSQVPE
jgi:hypothetical protein